MKKSFIGIVLFWGTFVLSAQDYTTDFKDCNQEKDRVHIDWDNEINQQYAERKMVERFTQKRLRQFYCENLVARDRLDAEGYVISKGGFQSADHDEKYLRFTIEMGDVLYYDKLYIHVGTRPKLLSSELNN